MNFYNDALACNTLPHEWGKDGEGVWERREAPPAPDAESSRTSRTTPSSYTSLFETQAAFNLLHVRNGTNPTSISSVITEHDPDADKEEDNPKTPESDGSTSGRVSPRQQQSTMDHTLAGVGDALMNERPRRRPTRLEEPNDVYGKTFMEFKQRCAVDKILAADAGEATSTGPYQLAVHSHDDLCLSNGHDRMNEERAAVCARINIDVHAGEHCTICYRPPDYYHASGHQAVTEEEAAMSAADVEWSRRGRRGDAAAE